MATGIVIALTEEQQAALKPLFDMLRQMDDEGAPGMAIAQLYPDHMACGFLSHEKATRLNESLRSTADITESAYDRS